LCESFICHIVGTVACDPIPFAEKAAMKAFQIEESKSRRKSDSQRGLRMARRLRSVLQRPEANRIGAAGDKGRLMSSQQQ
jgi:hypothetical protein